MIDLNDDADLVEFSFESKVVGDLPGAVLLRLSRQASAFNASMGLTGRLVMRDGRFIQSLEGSADILLPLAARILADPRHGAIRTIAFRAVPTRHYSKWTVEGFETVEPGDSFGTAVRFTPLLPVRRRAANSASIHSIGTGSA